MRRYKVDSTLKGTKSQRLFLLPCLVIPRWWAPSLLGATKKWPPFPYSLALPQQWPWNTRNWRIEKRSGFLYNVVKSTRKSSNVRAALLGKSWLIGAVGSFLEVYFKNTRWQPPSSTSDEFWIFRQLQQKCCTTRPQWTEFVGYVSSITGCIDSQSVLQLLESGPEQLWWVRPELTMTVKLRKRGLQKSWDVWKIYLRNLMFCSTSSGLRCRDLYQCIENTRRSIVGQNEICTGSGNGLANTHQTTPSDEQHASFTDPSPK